MRLDINLKKAILSLKKALQVAWLSLWSELALDLLINLASVWCRTWQMKIPSFSVAFHVSPSYDVLPAHLPQLVCITSLIPLDLTLPTLASIGCNIYTSLVHCSGADIHATRQNGSVPPWSFH